MNQIKQGYKQTKVGIIPNDWEVVKVGEVLKIGSGKDYKHLSTGNIPVYGTGGYMLSVNEYLHDGESVCIGRKGTIDKPMFLNEKFWTVDTLFYTHSFKNSLPKYVYLTFLSIDWQKYNEASGVPSLSKTTIETIQIPLPPLKEQQKIAEILTTWDEAIGNVELLILNYQLRKKALMQKLLSGEVRFGGFSDEWENIRLGKYIKEISKKNKENIELVLSVTNKHGFIAQKDYFDKEVASKDTSNYKIVKKGNFAYNPSRINVGSLGLLEEYEIGILSPMYVIFECLKGLDKQYLNYWLNTHNFTGNLSKFLSGSVRDSLAFNDMKLMKIKLPSLPEQQKIAEVLSLADDEINLLKKELEELKLQKKALMQKLLTGEVRVKV